MSYRGGSIQSYVYQAEGQSEQAEQTGQAGQTEQESFETVEAERSDRDHSGWILLAVIFVLATMVVSCIWSVFHSERVHYNSLYVGNIQVKVGTDYFAKTRHTSYYTVEVFDTYENCQDDKNIIGYCFIPDYEYLQTGVDFNIEYATSLMTDILTYSEFNDGSSVFGDFASDKWDSWSSDSDTYSWISQINSKGYQVSFHLFPERNNFYVTVIQEDFVSKYVFGNCLLEGSQDFDFDTTLKLMREFGIFKGVY